MSIRMYHPQTGGECEALTEAQAAVYRESGWLDAPEPEQREGYEPEPVRYGPVSGLSEGPVRPVASAVREEWADWVEHLGGEPEGLTIAELKAKADELESDSD
jgi:hypothetical protein